MDLVLRALRALAIVAVAAVVLAGATIAGQALAELRRGAPIGDALAGGSAPPVPAATVTGPIAWSPRAAPPWTPAPAATPAPVVLSARIDAPASITNDVRTLRYTVTLTNESASTYTFGECPVYTEYFVKNLGRYYLDCDAVRSLAPDASATFEMRLDLDPRATPPQADWDLRWELDPRPNSATATARIHVALVSTISPAPKPLTTTPPKGTP